MQLSIIIPIYNEEQILPELHERLTKAALQITEDYELIFVNDGSRDGSLFGLRANRGERRQNILY